MATVNQHAAGCMVASHDLVFDFVCTVHGNKEVIFTHIGCSRLIGSGTPLGPFNHVALAESSSFAWITPPAV